jgi:hypothetical protein
VLGVVMLTSDTPLAALSSVGRCGTGAAASALIWTCGGRQKSIETAAVATVQAENLPKPQAHSLTAIKAPRTAFITTRWWLRFRQKLPVLLKRCHERKH